MLQFLAIPDYDIYQMLDSTVREMRYSPEFAEKLKDLSRHILDERSDSNRTRDIEIDQRITKIAQNKDLTIDLYINGEIDKPSLRRKMKVLDAEHALLMDKKKLVETDYTKIIMEVMNLIDQLRDRPVSFLSASYKEKANILKTMAEGVLIGEESAQILWKEPFSFLLKNEILEYKVKFERAKKEVVNAYALTTSGLPVMDETLTVAMNTAITEYEFYYVRQKTA